MPLAPAHPAVVLPLQRLGLPLGALVAGAIAPDAPAYLPVGVGYRSTHVWPGLLLGALLGLAGLLLWWLLIRDPLVDLVPALRDRLPLRARPVGRAWLLAPLALVTGVGSHVLWDAATHDWGVFVVHLDILRADAGPLPVYRWLQHTSTVLGTIGVAAYGLTRLHRHPVTGRRSAVRGPWRWWLLVAAAPLVALGAGVRAEAALGWALVALLLVSVVWRVACEQAHAPGCMPTLTPGQDKGRGWEG